MTWDGDMYKMGNQFREWRTACFWRWRRGLIIRSLTIVLPEYAIQKGYAYAGNQRLANQCWTSREAIDHALTAMIAGNALIRVYAIDGSDEERRLYLAKGVIDEMKASSKTDVAIVAK